MTRLRRVGTDTTRVFLQAQYGKYGNTETLGRVRFLTRSGVVNQYGAGVNWLCEGQGEILWYGTEDASAYREMKSWTAEGFVWMNERYSTSLWMLYWR